MGKTGEWWKTAKGTRESESEVDSDRSRQVVR